jgi:23S rRNA (uridine2552-2'-O)-methyltransferase
VYDRKDSFYERAKTEGYRSRAAFKLLELARANKLIRKGDAVLDLGAWPGGWLQVASELVGPRGLVVGIDQRPIDDLGLANVHTLAGDINDPGMRDAVGAIRSEPFDVILSDLAPSLSGIRDRDEAQADILLDGVLAWTAQALRPGGGLLIKLFMGSGFEQRRNRLRRAFAAIRLTRPDATRKGSAEMYAIAREHRPGAV